ncbi:MAG: hypothetical protein PHS92_03715 [Candidatus Gracilibacteria bacterium]|nr:hypothetical protein [Candidatus Gracilibacteria bacterium]
MSINKKVLVCLGITFLLSIPSSTPTHAFEDTELDTFSEFPNSYEIFLNEAIKQSKNFGFCKGIKECIFYDEYVDVLNFHIFTLSNNLDDLYYIENQYGKYYHDWILDNRLLIEEKFDEYLTKDIMNYLGGMILNEENGFNEEQIHNIYFGYIKNEGFYKLYKAKNKTKDLKQQVIYDYMIYLLFSDIRLYKIN